jgi:DNA-binding transcriptional ArsR family regulator
VTADAVLRALAEPQRIRILRLVGDRELAAGEIAEHFDITAQAVSQHLRVLKAADVLRERRDGTRRLYSIRPEAIESVHAFLQELWPTSLDRLKQVVESGGAHGDAGSHTGDRGPAA